MRLHPAGKVSGLIRGLRGRLPAGLRRPLRRPAITGLRRPGRASLLIGVLLALLGFALAAQVRSNEASALPSARQEDLVRILDDLAARETRLRTEISDLQVARAKINTSGDRTEAALQEARQRAAQLGVLAGTVAAHGPGLKLTLSEGSRHIAADVLLDALEELRGAGAEAVQFGDSSGSTVRVGSSTWFTDTDSGISVDGTKLTAPYQIIAIGDPATMAAALNIPGGVSDTVRQARGTLRIDQSRNVVITALRPLEEPQYARPAK
ncbi:MAG: DUF881 domain-containing protein [Actinomycetota bacterium]|nr:DUF881 domain-containing protein [Actinomycetota bacterium]